MSTRPLNLLSMALLLALSVACTSSDYTKGSTEDDANDTDATESDTADVDARTEVRIDVSPPSGSGDEALDALLPQTFLDRAAEDYALLRLQQPITLSGTVSAYSVTSWFSDPLPPGEDVVIADAEVALRSSGTVHSSFGRTAEDGTFSLRVVPDDDYRLSIVPDDDSVPMYTSWTPLAIDTELTIDLGYGAAVWGFVLDEEEEPVADAYVFLEAEDGTLSSATLTSGAGFFLLRGFAEERYRIVVEGPVDGTVFTDSPVVTTDAFLLEEDGTQVDVSYPTLRRASLNGQVTTLDGSAAEDIVVQVRSVSLEDYPNGTLSFTTDTDRNGRYSVWAVPGTYEVALLPADDDEKITSTWASEEGDITVEEGDSVTIETTLASFVDIVGQVQDEVGNAVSEALVSCSEAGFGERTYAVLADDVGVFSFYGPASELVCTISPPTSMANALGITRTSFDAGNSASPTFVVAEGTEIAGQVLFEDAPVQYATVEIRDASGELWTVALTDADGEYSVRIAID